jgi:hypothetical protein
LIGRAGERGFPGKPFDVALRYRVLRVWKASAAARLSGGVGFNLGRLEALVLRVPHVKT